MFLKYISALPYLILIFLLTSNAFAAANSWTVEKDPLNSNLKFYWNDVANNPAMNIKTNNNVGIGTNDPLGKLDILSAPRSGTAPTTPSFYVTGTLSNGLTGPAANNIEFRHNNQTQGIGFGYQTIYATGSNSSQPLNILSRGGNPITLNNSSYSTGGVVIGTYLQMTNNGSLFYMPQFDTQANTSYNGTAAWNGPGMADGVPYYFGIGREPGDWADGVNVPDRYPDLVISNHTGVKVAAHGAYGGFAVYDQYDWINGTWTSKGTEVARFKAPQAWGGPLGAIGSYAAGNISAVSFTGSGSAGSNINGTYIGLFKSYGSLPGYPSNQYPTLKTDNEYLYFSVNGAYSAWMNSAGTISAQSSRLIKENYTPLNYDEILNKIDQLPVMQWNFKSEDPSIKHIGPFAEDFHQLFGFSGTDNSRITNTDSVGVSLAGVKALIKENDDLKQRLDDLTKRIEALEQTK